MNRAFLWLVFFVLIIAILGFQRITFDSKYELKPYHFSNISSFPTMPLPEEQITVEGAMLGRYLFYDSILSRDYSMSCSSCHHQSNAFSDVRMKSVGVNGDTLERNSMALFNLAWYPRFFWDGRASSIEDQVLFPVNAHNELGLGWEKAVSRLNQNSFYREKFKILFGDHEIDSIMVTNVMGQFLRTLISADSKYDRVLQKKDSFYEDELAGFILMNEQNKGNCLHCHPTDSQRLGTNLEFTNNGLQNAKFIDEYQDLGLYNVTSRPQDIGKFKVPSLRNIALTAPYMHDGSFKTLEEVLDFYSEGVHPSLNIDHRMAFQNTGGVHLNDREKEQIIAFLNTLTDSTFITNEAFSNPFKN